MWKYGWGIFGTSIYIILGRQDNWFRRRDMESLYITREGGNTFNYSTMTGPDTIFQLYMITNPSPQCTLQARGNSHCNKVNSSLRHFSDTNYDDCVKETCFITWLLHTLLIKRRYTLPFHKRTHPSSPDDANTVPVTFQLNLHTYKNITLYVRHFFFSVLFFSKILLFWKAHSKFQGLLICESFSLNTKYWTSKI